MNEIDTDPSAFRAIADPSRRRILDDLCQGERSVSDLTRLLGVSQPTVSKHLVVLREAGLVQQRKAGRFSFYALQPNGLKEVASWISSLSTFWDDRLDALTEYLDADEQQPALAQNVEMCEKENR